jgi:FKBP-type peptidyl-prolyl cis-trans isomerase
MALIDNQTYKKKVSFVSSENDNDRVVINLSVTCNHEIPKDILTSIEEHINSLFITNYITEEEYKEIVKQQKENEKMQEKLQKENEKLRKENEKMQQKMQKEQEKKKPVEQKSSLISSKPVGMKNRFN